MQLINLFVIVSFICITFALPAAQFEVDIPAVRKLNTTELETRQAGKFSYWPSVDFPNQILGPPYCYPKKPMAGNICMLTNRMPDGNPQWLELYLYNHNCVQIGGNSHVEYSIQYDLESELPYVIVIHNINGGVMGFGYAGRWSDGANDDAHCYNTGLAGSNHLQPACQMEFQC